MAYLNGVDFTLPNGKTIKLYGINVLAEALGRSPATVRKWEVAGYIPPTPFKHDVRKCRLYSQEMIDIIVSCAERAKLSAGRPVAHTRFQKWVHEEMEVLYKKYRRKTLPGRKKKNESES